MDGALLLIAANESCPQPQTSEHLAAVEIMKLKEIIILQVQRASLLSISLAASSWGPRGQDSSISLGVVVIRSRGRQGHSTGEEHPGFNALEQILPGLSSSHVWMYYDRKR